MEDITAQQVRTLIPKRRESGYKGDFGRIYVYGGSTDYTGAPVYAAEAAARTGSGLVYLGVPAEIYPIAAIKSDAAIVQPLPGEGELEARMGKCDAVLIGPGLGRDASVEERVLRLIKNLTVPVVIDADGINAISAHNHVLEGRRGVTVVTPHEGEFARLDSGFIPGGGNRAESAAKFACGNDCVVVLKGPGTIVAAPDGRTWRNTTGNSGMAKGGSGDILGGMIASLIGQGAGALEAAICAVWLHGRAGDLAKERLTAYAMTPSDVLRYLPAAFKELEG